MSDTEPQSRIGSSERVRPVPDSPVDAVLSLQAPIGDYEARIRGVRPITCSAGYRVKSASMETFPRHHGSDTKARGFKLVMN